MNLYCMKYIKCMLALVCLASAVHAQKPVAKPIAKPVVNEYAAVDKKALELPEAQAGNTTDIAAYINANFITDKDKTRAIFIWTASNIQYDVENMFAMNFYEKQDEKIAKALRNRKGICENYAAVFNDICAKAGIKSYVIEGYTKQNGFTDYIPHAWCAARVDSAWYLFDPTWGSGYISNAKFVKHINNAYCKADPATLIKSHMPFDPMWEFLQYPVTNQEFYEGKTTPNKTKPVFSYIDSIQVYEQSGHTEKLQAAARRIEQNGVKNSMIFDRLQHIKMEIENDRQAEIVTLFNSASHHYNDGIASVNDFINYRNKQFTPMKTDPEIQAMLDAPANEFKIASAKLASIKNPDANASTSIAQLTKAIDDASVHLKEQQDWLTTYFGKKKAGRKSMFYEKKYTWFGVPLN